MSDYREPPEAGVGGPEPLTPTPPTGPRADREITGGVQTAFFLDPELPEPEFEVHTTDGVVHLHGTVDSEEIRQRAVAVALGVAGVRDVDDHIRVRSR